MGTLAQERVLALDRTDRLGEVPPVQVLPRGGLLPPRSCAPALLITGESAKHLVGYPAHAERSGIVCVLFVFDDISR